MTKYIVTMTSLLVLSTTAFAVPLHQPTPLAPPLSGQGGIGTPYQKEMWLMTSIIDNSPNPVSSSSSLQVCFYPVGSTGTHDEYRWEIISPPGVTFGGNAVQEGDQIFMVGEGYKTPSSPNTPDFFTSIQWEIVSNLGTGHWQYWTLDPLFLYFNVILNRDHQNSGLCP